MGLWTTIRSRLFGWDNPADACRDEPSDTVKVDVSTTTDESSADVSASAEQSNIEGVSDVVAPDPAHDDAPTDVAEAVADAEPMADIAGDATESSSEPSVAVGEPRPLTSEVYDVSARQERAASMLLDDERLRGDLTDDEYQPLLGWALAVTDRIAEATATLDDDAASGVLEAGVAEVKALVRLAAESVAARASDGAEGSRAALEALASRAGALGSVMAGAADARGRVEVLIARLADEPVPGSAEQAVQVAEALAPLADHAATPDAEAPA